MFTARVLAFNSARGFLRSAVVHMPAAEDAVAKAHLRTCAPDVIRMAPASTAPHIAKVARARRDHRQLVPADHQSHRRRPGRRKCCAATEAETLKASTEGGKELRRHQSHSYVACFLADAQPAVSAVTPPGPCGNSWLGHLRALLRIAGTS